MDKRFHLKWKQLHLLPMRLAAASSSWTIGPQGMFRIINWPKLCEALSLFCTEGKGSAPFEIAIGCTWKRKQADGNLSMGWI